MLGLTASLGRGVRSRPEGPKVLPVLRGAQRQPEFPPLLAGLRNTYLLLCRHAALLQAMCCRNILSLTVLQCRRMTTASRSTSRSSKTDHGEVLLKPPLLHTTGHSHIWNLVLITEECTFETSNFGFSGLVVHSKINAPWWSSRQQHPTGHHQR